MSYCSKCGQELNGASYCPSCGSYAASTTGPVQSANNTPDEKSTGLNILSFFMPLIGIIFYFVDKQDKPIRAKSAGKSALAGIICQLVLSILATVLFVGIFAAGFAGLVGSVDDAIPPEDEFPGVTIEDPSFYVDEAFNSTDINIPGYDISFSTAAV